MLGIIVRTLTSFGKSALMRFYHDSETVYAGIKAPSSFTGVSVDYTLPSAPNSDGLVLSATTTGVLNWVVGGEANSGGNLGSGAQIYAFKSGTTLLFRTLKFFGALVTDLSDPNSIIVTCTAEANTASNVGAGAGRAGVFKTKSGIDLQFRSLRAGTNITLDTSDPDTVGINATGGGGGSGTITNATNLGLGLGWFTTPSGSNLQFRSVTASVNPAQRIASGSDIVLANNANDIGIGVVGTVPIGGIIIWYNMPGSSLPANFLSCDGTTISDAASPLNGAHLPALNNLQKFIRGSTVVGSGGGNDTHSHPIHTGTMCVPPIVGTYNQFPYDIGSTDSVVNVPPYLDVIFIMRVK